MQQKHKLKIVRLKQKNKKPNVKLRNLDDHLYNLPYTK